MPEKDLKEVGRQARDFYEKGRNALERNTLEAAVELLGEAVKAEPAFFRARQLLRVAQIKKQKAAGGSGLGKFFGRAAAAPKLATISPTKDPAKAMEAAEEVLDGDPTNLQALRVLSQAAEAADLMLTACFAYETARDAYPDNKDVLLQLGHLYQSAGKADRAQECFQRVLDLEPGHPEAAKGLKDSTANQAMAKANYEGSYRDNISDKDEALKLEQAGRVFKDEDVVKSQMAEVHKLTQEQPDNPTHWRKLGELALIINDFDYALQSFQYASHVAKDSDPIILKAISETRTKRVTFKLRQQEEVLAADPNNAEARQAVEALKLEREQIILEECEGRARKYPNDLDIRYDLGRALFRAGEIKRAIPEFQLAGNNPKNKVACINWLGLCFKHQGMLDMAEQRFKNAAEQCLIMDSLKKEVLYNLGAVYEEMNREDDAIEQYKQIYDVDVGYKDVSEKIEAHYTKKRAAKA